MTTQTQAQESLATLEARKAQFQKAISENLTSDYFSLSYITRQSKKLFSVNVQIELWESVLENSLEEQISYVTSQIVTGCGQVADAPIDELATLEGQAEWLRVATGRRV